MLDYLQGLGGWILLLPLGATFLGATVQRTTGFGFGFIAGAGTLTVFNPIVAVLYTSIANMLLSGTSTWQLRKDVDVRVSGTLIGWMCVGIVIGLVLIGVALRWWLQALALAVTLWALLEGVQAILRRRKARSSGQAEQPGTVLSVLGAAIPGILSGFLGTCLGVPGPPIIGYLLKLGLSPFTVRSSLLAMFFFSSLTRILIFPLIFQMPSFDYTIMSMMIGVTVAGTVLGAYLGRIIPADMFAYVNLAALGGSGSVLGGALVIHFWPYINSFLALVLGLIK